MAETAALLADEVFPDVPLRQWVISFPFPLRYLFAAHPQAMGKVLGLVYRVISTHLIYKAGSGMPSSNIDAAVARAIARRWNGCITFNITRADYPQYCSITLAYGSFEYLHHTGRR